MPGVGKAVTPPGVLGGALLNQTPDVPEAALKFEGTDEYIFFEGDEVNDYITFETTEA